MENPLVSVCCLAYNQEHFITQAIESFLMQKTNFSIEIIIHDDASTDSTPQIINKYVERFPNIIIPIFQTENQYSKGSFSILDRIVFPKVRGKYIATCEGDDYWTDPYKLQKQVDFMEINPGYGMIYTNTKVYYQESGVFKDKGSVQYQSFEQLLSNYNSKIPTPTVLIRKSSVEQYRMEIQPEHQKWLMGDYPQWLFTAKQSKLKYLDEITAVYRWQKESASRSLSTKKTFEFLKSVFEIKMYFAAKYKVANQIVLSIMNDHYKYSIFYAIQNNDFIFVEECNKFLKEQKMNIELGIVQLLVIFKKMNFNFPLQRKVYHIWRNYRIDAGK